MVLVVDVVMVAAVGVSAEVGGRSGGGGMGPPPSPQPPDSERVVVMAVE